MAEITLPRSEFIIDSHAHVMEEYFKGEQQSVIARAFASGVTQFVNPGCTLEAIPELIGLADSHENIFIAVGVHPHEAKDWTDLSAGTVRQFAGHKKVVAIGECGLDFYYNHSDEPSQVRALTEQIHLALEFDKPIIIHCRDAWDKVFKLLEDEGKGKLRGVFHCFTGGPELLPRIAQLDFYVSFSGIVTYPNAKNIQEAAAIASKHRILVETDCPYLAPQKVRGKRNEPAYVWFVAEKLAQLRGETLSEVARVCCENTRELFRLPMPAP